MAEPALKHLKPTLVVGVGGIGCWIADRVYAMAVENGIDTSSRIGVLGFDTDKTDLGRLVHLGTEQLIQTSTADTLFTVLNRRGDGIRSWFVDDAALTAETRQMTLLDGAGAIRMFSRLAFDEAMGRVDDGNRLDMALAAIATRDNLSLFEGRVNVLLVGSLAGGTGAGMFLQTALLLAAKMRASGITPLVRGLFLLPDIIVRAGRIAPDQIDGVRANGYAALKELHAVMLHTLQRDTDGPPVELEYVRGHQLQPDGMPFASVTLMDYEDQRGASLGHNFDAYRELAAQSAYTLMFTPIGGSADQQTVNDVRARLAAAGEGTDRSMAGLGISAAIYPEQSMLDYLQLRFGLSMLDDDWLRLDQTYRDELDRYRDRLAMGETSLEPPDPGDSYIRSLEQLAKAERIPFFRAIHDGVYKRIESTTGADDVIEAQHVKLLDALERHLLAAFWDSDPKLAGARDRQQLGEGTLTDKDSVAQDVNLYERQLHRDFEAIERALVATVDELFHTNVVAASLLGASDWKDHHLESYVVRGGPHLVQVRYFLYKLVAEIRSRDKTLGSSGALTREAIEKRLKEHFDDPETGGVVETARDLAMAIQATPWPEWADRKFKSFQVDYRDYYNKTRRLILELAEVGTLQKLYELLERYVLRLLDVVVRFFNDLEKLRIALALERNRMEVQHDLGTAASDGRRYVFADQQAKQASWEELRTRLQSLASGGSDVNAALSRALIERFRAEARPASRFETLPQLAGAALFRTRIIDGYCRDQIVQNHGDVYRMPVVEAIRREAVLKETDPERYLRQVVGIVDGQSAPFISTSTPEAGQLYRFWAIATENREALGNEPLFLELFTSNVGETPVVEPELPSHTLLCVSARVNLRVADLRKLDPGLDAASNVSAAQAGAYYQAYQRLVDRLIDHERNDPDAPPPTFTPHLDKRWHRAGVLPEIHPELEQRHVRELLDAYVLGLALGLLPWDQREGRPVTLFRDQRKLGEPDYDSVLTEGHDDFSLLGHLREQPAKVRAVLEHPKRLIGGSDHDAHAALYRGLANAGTLARIFRLMADRTRADRADQLASEAMLRLFEHLREANDRQHRQLGALARAEELRKVAAVVIEGAIEEVAQDLYEDALLKARQMAEGQLKKVVD